MIYLNPNLIGLVSPGNSLGRCLIVRLNHSANSIALVIIDIVLCGVAFVCFGKLVKRVDLSTKQEKQQASTLHIGTHILSKDNTQGSSQTRYQLNSHPYPPR
jgi:phosphotransferase system  glucose/maltose/N-acetylglucosamine-specific IIC component